MEIIAYLDQFNTVEEISNEIKRQEELYGKAKGTESEVYSRIVGYYRTTKNWNKGKSQEFVERKEYTKLTRD